MTDRLYNDGRTMALMHAATQDDVDWQELGPQLAEQVRELRNELVHWMQETRHATQIADTWKARYRALTEELEDIGARHPLA